MKNEVVRLDNSTSAIIIKSPTYGIFRVLVDSGDLSRISAMESWSISSSRKYIASTLIFGHKVLLHRLIMSFPDGCVVDHKNGDPWDNRKSNLRVTSPLNNSRNRKVSKNNKLGLKGVRERNGRFESCIYLNYKSIHLGVFPNKLLAAQAYDLAAKELYGEFAATNFPA